MIIAHLLPFTSLITTWTTDTHTLCYKHHHAERSIVSAAGNSLQLSSTFTQQQPADLTRLIPSIFCRVSRFFSSNRAHRTVGWLLFWGPLNAHTQARTKQYAYRSPHNLSRLGVRLCARAYKNPSTKGAQLSAQKGSSSSARSTNLADSKSVYSLHNSSFNLSARLLRLPRTIFLSFASILLLLLYHTWLIFSYFFDLPCSLSLSLCFASTFQRNLFSNNSSSGHFFSLLCLGPLLGLLERSPSVCVCCLFFPRRRLIVSHTHINFFVVIFAGWLLPHCLLILLLARIWEKPGEKRMFKKKTET